MSTQTDVLASQARTDDGQLLTQGGDNILRCRIKSVFIVPSGTAGSVVFKDGGASGTTRMTINTVASASQPQYMLLPGEGVLFSTNVYVDVTNIGSVMVFYG
ncbi:hypothetical protein EBT31_01140 [bacterium]|jgi:hypothetical protein|nr:hypothetical protein [bacterium]